MSRKKLETIFRLTSLTPHILFWMGEEVTWSQQALLLLEGSQHLAALGGEAHKGKMQRTP